MTRSSILSFSIILVLFVAIQGWVLYAKFLQPTSIESLQASLMGETMMIGTPVSGIVQSVNVTDGQHVDKGQPLFVIAEQSPLEPNGELPVMIVAQRAGVVHGMDVTADSFVQASQILARVVDISPEGLYIQATLPLSPEKFPTLAVTQRAIVQSSFLNNGKPIAAVITNIGMFDGLKHTVDVRLRMLETLPKGSTPIIGLPVQVTVMMDEEGKVSAAPFVDND